jgi:uncharacterized protein YkwD
MKSVLKFITVSISALILSLVIIFLTAGNTFAVGLSNQEVGRLVNQQRIENYLPTLKFNQILNMAAEAKLRDMVTKGYWAHNSPTNQTPWSFILQSGYRYVYAGENLAMSVGSETDAVSRWMGSEGHKKNILNIKYQETGIAVYEGVYMGRPTTLIVQLFASKTRVNQIALVN